MSVGNNGWLKIDGAPKDGRLVQVCHLENDVEEMKASMRWDSKGESYFAPNSIGLWVSSCGTFTWSDADGFGPSHYREIQ